MCQIEHIIPYSWGLETVQSSWGTWILGNSWILGYNTHAFIRHIMY
jgi:hypothetical protein